MLSQTQPNLNLCISAFFFVYNFKNYIKYTVKNSCVYHNVKKKYINVFKCYWNCVLFSLSASEFSGKQLNSQKSKKTLKFSSST